VDRRINGKVGRVTYRDESTLVIEPDGAPRSLQMSYARSIATMFRPTASSVVMRNIAQCGAFSTGQPAVALNLALAAATVGGSAWRKLMYSLNLTVGDMAAGQAAVPHRREEPACYPAHRDRQKTRPFPDRVGRQIRDLSRGCALLTSRIRRHVLILFAAQQCLVLQRTFRAFAEVVRGSDDSGEIPFDFDRVIPMPSELLETIDDAGAAYDVYYIRPALPGYGDSEVRRACATCSTSPCIPSM
jgi:hypothetical protein